MDTRVVAPIVVVAVIAECVERWALIGECVLELFTCEDVYWIKVHEFWIDVVEQCGKMIVAEFVAVEGDERTDSDCLLGVGLESCGGFVEFWEEDSHEESAYLAE